MQVVYDDKAIIFDTTSKNAEKITSYLEKSEVLYDDGYNTKLVVAWELPEMQHVASVDCELKLPSPITKEYQWPGMFTPFTHQRTTAEFLSLRKRAFCFNEAGTGKTASVIWAADYLMNKGLIKRVLVICPLSIMYSAWLADVFSTAMHRTVAVAHGSAKKRIKIIEGEYEFVIINFDGIASSNDELKKAKFDLIVADEASAFKTASTKRWKALQRLLTPDTRLWMLTGTPASQSPLDAFGIARLVSPDRVPRFYTAWRDKVMIRVTQFKYVQKDTATQDVYTALQPAIRFTKDECLDLPDIVYQTREIALSPQVAKYYKELKSQMLIEAAGEEITAVNAAAKLSKLLQISGGAVYTDTKEIIEFDVTPRLTELKNIIDEASHKVLIFVPYSHTISLVGRFLTEKGIVNAVIDGNASANNRRAIIDMFQTQDDIRVLIIQPQAGAHGITLTAANTAVFWSPVMSVEVYLQCVARVNRLGQKNKMLVVNMQGSEAERKMYEMLQGKITLHGNLVDLYKNEIGL
jgi:SNF2 family DNA or RNA helicase